MKKEELPIKVLMDDFQEVMLKKCTSLDDPIIPDLSTYAEEDDAVVDANANVDDF